MLVDADEDPAPLLGDDDMDAVLAGLPLRHCKPYASPAQDETAAPAAVSGEQEPRFAAAWNRSARESSARVKSRMRRPPWERLRRRAGTPVMIRPEAAGPGSGPERSASSSGPERKPRSIGLERNPPTPEEMGPEGNRRMSCSGTAAKDSELSKLEETVAEESLGRSSVEVESGVETLAERAEPEMARNMVASSPAAAAAALASTTRSSSAALASTTRSSSAAE
jgi:hypothetical protein